MTFNVAQFGKGHRFDRVIIEAGIIKVKRWENCILEQYFDYNGDPAIGYGHTNAMGTPPVVFVGMPPLKDEAEAHTILLNDMETVARTLRKWIKVPVTDYMFNGLDLLAMNVGLGNFRDGATNPAGETLPSVLEALNGMHHSLACSRFQNHRYASKALKDPATGKVIIDPATEKPKTEIVELVGLINRRADEMALFLTKID